MADNSRRMNGAYGNPLNLLTEQEMDSLIGCPIVTEIAHSVTVGTVLYESAAGVFSLADASSEATFQNGICICAFVIDVDTYVVWRPGASKTLAWAAHGIGTPTFGEGIYLQDVAGTLDTTPGSHSVRCGYLRDANNIQWEPGLIS